MEHATRTCVANPTAWVWGNPEWGLPSFEGDWSPGELNMLVPWGYPKWCLAILRELLGTPIDTWPPFGSLWSLGSYWSLRELSNPRTMPGHHGGIAWPPLQSPPEVTLFSCSDIISLFIFRKRYFNRIYQCFLVYISTESVYLGWPQMPHMVKSLLTR